MATTQYFAKTWNHSVKSNDIKAEDWDRRWEETFGPSRKSPSPEPETVPVTFKEVPNVIKGGAADPDGWKGSKATVRNGAYARIEVGLWRLLYYVASERSGVDHETIKALKLALLIAQNQGRSKDRPTFLCECGRCDLTESAWEVMGTCPDCKKAGRP